MSLLSITEARAKILELVEPGAPVHLPVEQARGLCTVADARAAHPLPRFANSSMDGFAVRAGDLAEGRGLTVVGEVRAGDPGDLVVETGTAVRIMTGAPVPPGTDAIVPIEMATETGGRLHINDVPSSSYIRPAGDDIAQGEVAVAAGTRLGPGELALLAALGASPVEVRSLPRVACVTSGDELVPPELEPASGEIRDSNAVALAALAEETGAAPFVLPRVPDDPEAVTMALQTAAAEADLVVSAGGVSVGRHDHVREVVERDGEVSLWRVAMQPGKPVLAGRIYGTPFIGLPGNPVSVHVGFEQFVRPALLKMLGARELLRPVARAVLTERITKPVGRLHLVRVRLRLEDARLLATPTGPQGSHIQTSLLGCDGLARFDVDLTVLEKGDEVEVEVWRFPDSVL